MQSYDRSRVLIPTLGDDTEYGAAPAPPPKASRQQGDGYGRAKMVVAALGGAAMLAVAGLRGNNMAALGGPTGIEKVLASQNTHFQEIAASRLKGIEMMANMKVRPQHGVPNARAALGASEYQRCVSHDSHASAVYNTSDHEQLREDLLFDISRDEYPAVTAYNDSKALLAEVTCEAAPPASFTDTEVCTSVEGFCDVSCEMPVPDHCITGDKSFGTCEPTVNHICGSLEVTHNNCEHTQRQSMAAEDRYNKHEVGTPPCRVDADAPFAKAAYAQMKYEASYVDWVNAVNDATEVCTIGHALWVHNLGLYQAHYAKLEATTADLIQLCSGQNHTDEFDIDGAIADASLSYQRASKGPLSHANDRRRLVWWQQLCEPSIHALEELIKSLEIASPQLMCFAETCQQKKAGEQVAFEVLVNAHNKFEMAFADYRDEVVAYNDGVEQKHLALAATISSFESFHVIQEELHLGYEKDMDLFDRFDSGADNGHCGLTDCQVQAVCGAQLKSHFETFVSTDTCTPAPYSVDKVCNPPPSPPPPSPAPVAVEAEKDLEVETLPEPVLPEEKAKEEKAEAEHAGEEPMPMPQGPYSVGARAW
jgi:hypothetical protein|mmetsp:Transcript_8218/g.37443  ORF Transcript_8218/g.37443 Transcript_8218/m.37443 type:complete len:593 (+) Transcript_8218:118-1896(+)